MPRTYQEACEQSGYCTGATGRVPERLVRPLHFPELADSRCPGSPARYVSAPAFGSMALGTGLVRVGVDATPAHGGLRAGHTDFPGWRALKTHFFSFPAYRGPFLVRAQRLDRAGPVRLGGSPAGGGPLVVPPGSGWREVPYFTFFRSPGCYGWQVDGLTFSEIVVARVLPPREP